MASNRDAATPDPNQLSDEDLMLEFLAQSKVSRQCVDELMRKGFNSLYVLSLAEPEDLDCPEIPIGQQRLIRHVQNMLKMQYKSATTQKPRTLADETHRPPQPDGEYSRIPTNAPRDTSGDLYNAAILQALTIEQRRMQNQNGAASTPGPANYMSQQQDQQQQQLQQQQQQPQSWNDPQIHLATATGKSVTGYHDICDFVQSSVEEETVIGGHGDQQVIFKSGPKKPKLESLTLSQWSIANLAILYKMVGENVLVGQSMLDYLSYTTKVYQLVQRFSLMSVLLYDREYRKLQSQMGFRWGTDVPHLHTVWLQSRERPHVQGGLTKKQAGQTPIDARKDKSKASDVCRNFNSPKGCSYPNCAYKHECIIPGCRKSHTVMTHIAEKN